MKKLFLEYQMLTKTYLKPTYLPTYLCDSSYSSDSSDCSDSSDSSDSSDDSDSSNQKNYFHKKPFFTKNLFSQKKNVSKQIYQKKIWQNLFCKIFVFHIFFSPTFF